MRTNWIPQGQPEPQWCEGPAGEASVLCRGVSHIPGSGHWKTSEESWKSCIPQWYPTASRLTTRLTITRVSCHTDGTLHQTLEHKNGSFKIFPPYRF